MMKYFYVESTVSFTDNSEEEPWNSCENYSFIIEANKKEGMKEAKKRALEEFERDLGKMDDVKVTIVTFHQTTEDARPS